MLPVAEVAVELGLEHGLDDVVFAMQTLAVALWFTGDLARRDQLLADGRRIVCESCGANVRAAAGMFQLVALYTYHPVEALELADASLADSANFGYRHILEAYRAWLLMQLGRLDEAREAVERFSPVPPSSQWEQMNLIIAHAVIAHTGDIDTATKSYATAARSWRPVDHRSPGTSSSASATSPTPAVTKHAPANSRSEFTRSAPDPFRQRCTKNSKAGATTPTR